MYKLNDQIDIQDRYEMPAIAYVLCGTNFGMVDSDKDYTYHSILFIKQDAKENKVYLIGYIKRNCLMNKEYFKIVYDLDGKTTVKSEYKYYDIYSNDRVNEFEKALTFYLYRGDKVYISEDMFKYDEGLAYNLVMNNLDYFKPTDVIVTLRSPEVIEGIENAMENDD